MGSFLGNRWDIDFTDLRIFRDLAETPTVTDTTLALYSALQDLMDEPLNMDNPIPMSAQTPTEFTLINGWFIDDESTEFLTGGALQSISWEVAATEIRAISYDATGGGTQFETQWADPPPGSEPGAGSCASQSRRFDAVVTTTAFLGPPRGGSKTIVTA